MNSVNSQKRKSKIKHFFQLIGQYEFDNARIYILFAVIILVTGIIVLKLYSIQVLAHSYYQELADNQHSILKKLIPKRGEIFLQDQGGVYLVAVNKETKMAYAVPREIKNPELEAHLLAKILDLNKDHLRRKLSRSQDSYEVLKHRLSEGSISQLDSLKLEGIHLSDETYRYYPADKLASNVLGFVGWRGHSLGGRYGIEAYFNTKLQGQKGELYQNKDNSDSWISTGERKISQAKNGDSLVLTIDHTIQYETERILQGAIDKFEAKRGTIIVEEPKTGRILAMASYPNFNPNEYRNVSEMADFRNLAVSNAYECGSIFKTITMSAAIDNGKITPQTTYTDTGRVTEAGYTIRNAELEADGLQTMTQVLDKSLNTGAIYVEKLLGNRNFRDYVQRFGFGNLTKITLPGESAGNISNLNNLRSNIQFYTASFGQGITATPIQLVSAYSAIANGGILMKPQIVEKIIHSDGTDEYIEPQEVRRVISQKAAQEVAQMLRSVVVHEHGRRADVPGYLVGGKTGTAQVASSKKRGYVQGESIGSFAGFAPINNPRFVILVRMDDPKTVQWAESSAAPTFGELMKFLLDYKSIQPTEKYTQKDLALFNRTHTLKYYSANNQQKDNNQKNGNSK